MKVKRDALPLSVVTFLPLKSYITVPHIAVVILVKRHNIDICYIRNIVREFIVKTQLQHYPGLLAFFSLESCIKICYISFSI